MSHVVPKRKVAVRMLLTSGSVVSGDVFLDFIDPVHRGEQTLLDMFNKDALWFPVGSADGVCVVNRDQVLTVEPGPGVGPELVRRENSAVFRRESISLRIGERDIAGMIAMDLPDEFSRVSDFLNFPEDFFAVETGEGPVLVAKAQVMALTPHESPPPVPAADAGFEDQV